MGNVAGDDGACIYRAVLRHPLLVSDLYQRVGNNRFERAAHSSGTDPNASRLIRSLGYGGDGIRCRIQSRVAQLATLKKWELGLA